MTATKCSRCPNPVRKLGQRLCRQCHAENMRRYRAEHVVVQRAEAVSHGKNDAFEGVS